MKRTLHRLKKISPWNLPLFVLSKAVRDSRTLLEKSQSRYERPAPKARKEPIRVFDFPLFHPDVLAPGFGSLFKEKFPEQAKQVAQRAENARNLIVDLLGSGPVDLKLFRDRKDLRFIQPGKNNLIPARASGRVPWHFDFRSGMGWDPKTFWSDIKPDKTHGADIKIPWELSRCAGFLHLGQGYQLTQDERYPEAFVNQTQDWLDQNPFRFGVNWACPMDVALRAANWISAWILMRPSPALTEDFNQLFFDALWRHKRHIERHLEWSADISTNHYLSNLFGLFYLETFLRGPQYGQLMYARFVSALEKQALPDGFSFETSMGYHKLVFDMALYVYLIGKRLDLKGSKKDRRDESKLFTWLKKSGGWFIRLGSENGMVPLVGDNDSGQIHDWRPLEDGDVRFETNALALLGKNGEFKRAGWQQTPELAWLFGLSGWETFRALPSNAASLYQGKTSSSFLRLLSSDAMLAMNVLPNGTKGVGNHGHNDKLSVLFEAQGEWLLSDPGNYAYTGNPSLRNAFRKTRAHGTVEVDGEEQNPFFPDCLFTLGDAARVSVEKVSSSQIQAAHLGYQRLKNPVIHRRKITKAQGENSWRLEDSFETSGSHLYVWSFPAGRGIEIQENDQIGFDFVGQRGTLSLFCENPDLETSIDRTLFSPGYGLKEEGMTLRLKTGAPGPFAVTFVLTWRENARD